MKTKMICVALLSILLTVSNGFSQGFTPPAEGKAVVYFVRVTTWGFAISFEFFHQDKYISIFKGKNYIRYECDQGENLFWASSENKEFLTANLEAGESYIVLVDVIMGAIKARVGLTPITSTDKAFERAKKMVMNKQPVITSQKVIDSKTKKLEARGFIKEKLQQYETEWKDTKNFKHISLEMSIPKDLLK